MKTKFRSPRIWSSLLVAIAVMVVAGPGCTHVQVAPNTQGQYRLGELQVFADRNFKQVYDAAKAGMKDVGLFQTQDDRKVIEAELHGRDSTDTLVVVKIKEVGTNRTSVKIRYGVFTPDLAAAQRLYQAIEKRM